MTELIDDAQRLMMLQALGSICVRSDRGQMQALFDNEAQPTAFENAEVIVTGPRLEARSCDVARLGLRRGDVLTLQSRTFTVVHLMPDGHGFTIVGLEAA